MKRTVCIVLVLTALIGTVLPGVSVGDNQSLATLLTSYNEETKETVYNVYRSLLLKKLGTDGKEEALYAEMMHWYYQIYIATNRLELPLSQYKFYELAGSVSSSYTGDIALAQAAIDEYDLEQWKKYLNGEMSASEYMSYMIGMIGTIVNAEDQAQKDIDGTKK